MLQSFSDILEGPVAKLQHLSEQIGGEVAAQAKLLTRAFMTQLNFLKLTTQRSIPSNDEKCAMLTDTSEVIGEIQNIRGKYKRDGPFFNHLSAISESVAALGWVSVAPAPAPFVQEMGDAGQFYTNRVLRDWKDEDVKHVDWSKALLEIWSDLRNFVKKYHTTGLVWSGKGTNGVPLPPPPPVTDNSALAACVRDDRSALFEQINRGENITRDLKRVSLDSPRKNATKAGDTGSELKNACILKKNAEKAPIFTKDGKKWLIEHFRDKNDLLVDKAEMNNVIYAFDCANCTLCVKGKVNSIVMDSCSKFAVLFDTIVSSVEFVNCKSVKMQVTGKVPTISVDKTDGCQIFLNKESLGVEIISSKSSEMNVMIPKGNGDYGEYPIAEQFKTTVSSAGIKTVCVENRG